MKLSFTRYGVFALLNLAIISFYGSSQYFAALLIFVLSLAVLFAEGNKKLFFLYVVSAICGPVAEMIAVYTGHWTYAVTFIFGVPSWLFPLWGNAGLFVVATWSYISKRKN
ncbi:MAG: hypothetical protein WC797_01960 [Candidatus Paceibacterota bacterium]|jgi:hypothetical protein